jgi:signal transduction histidine kinase
MSPPVRRWLKAVLTSAALIAAVTAVIALLEPDVPAVGLGVLYLLAVLPIALVYGAAAAGAVSLASMAAFTYFFLPPRHTFDPGATEDWELIFAFLVSSLVVGVLAARSQREARRSARLADEQAALRRVATQVAQGVPPAEVFAAVALEVGRLLDVSATHMGRYDPDGAVTAVSSWSQDGAHMPAGVRNAFDATSVAGMVFTTAHPARKDHYADASGEIAAMADKLRIRSSAAAPVVIDARLWGVLIASSNGHQPLAADTEARIAAFTALVATAISNVEAREELAASRARIVAAADEERRRVVRDLHDGAQQRLVHSIITMKLARRALEPSQAPASELVSEALEQAERAHVELRELAHGILPAVLARGGLRAAVAELASRAPVPVDVSVSVDRLPAPVEAAAYFFVAEALTNVAKHARATGATVRAAVEDGTLRLHVSDDGVGGARTDGSGLVGMADRLSALDGRLRVVSPVDAGTVVAADIPIPA